MVIKNQIIAEMGKMKFRYLVQKILGSFLESPMIPNGKNIGFSLVKSERVDCIIGKHTRIYPPFFLHDVILGDYSYIAKNSSINNCEIGKFCSIGPNICCGMGIHPINGISTSPMFYSTAKQNGITLCKSNRIEEFKKTRIGNDVYIGTNVTLLDGITIGDGAVIGAGAVVTKDIPPYAVVAGVPAKIIKYRFEDKTVSALLDRKWWDDSIDDLDAIVEHFEDVQTFLGE